MSGFLDKYGFSARDLEALEGDSGLLPPAADDTLSASVRSLAQEDPLLRQVAPPPEAEEPIESPPRAGIASRANQTRRQLGIPLEDFEEEEDDERNTLERMGLAFKNSLEMAEIYSQAHLAAIGLADWEQARQRLDAFEDRLRNDPIEGRNWVEDIAVGAASLAGPMLVGGAEGAAAAGLTLGLGQLGPQALVPEEIVTVPVAQIVGSGQYWYRQGVGSIYAAARRRGVSHESASLIAQGAGIPYAAIEGMQVGKIAPVIKSTINRALGRGVERAAQRAATVRLGPSPAKEAARSALEFGKQAGQEIAEEGAQQIVDLSAQEMSVSLSNALQDTQVRYLAGDEIVDSMAEVFKPETAGALAALLAPAHINNAARRVSAARRFEKERASMSEARREALGLSDDQMDPELRRVIDEALSASQGRPAEAAAEESVDVLRSGIEAIAQATGRPVEELASQLQIEATETENTQAEVDNFEADTGRTDLLFQLPEQIQGVPFEQILTEAEQQDEALKGLKIPLTASPKTADKALAQLDNFLESDFGQNALRSPQDWHRAVAAWSGGSFSELEPARAIELANSPEAVAQQLRGLTDRQKQQAIEGLKFGDEVREAYRSGQIEPKQTAKFFLWSILSRGQPVYPHESGAMLAVLNNADQWIDQAIEAGGEVGILGRDLDPAVAEELGIDPKPNKVYWPEYRRWAKQVVQGTPAASVNVNLNAFGEDFLLGVTAPVEGGSRAGDVPLLALHEAIASDKTGPEIRREFHQLANKVGLDNKIVAFTLLVTGRKDMLVLDRVQAQNLWDAKRLAEEGKLTGKDGKPTDVIYGGIAKAPAGQKSKQAGGLADHLGSMVGLTHYEVLERGLFPAVRKGLDISAQEGHLPTLRDDEALGAYHWLSWALESGQEVGHGSMVGIEKVARGIPVEEAFDGVGVQNGRFEEISLGTVYFYHQGQLQFAQQKRSGDWVVLTDEGQRTYYQELSAHKGDKVAEFTPQTKRAPKRATTLDISLGRIVPGGMQLKDRETDWFEVELTEAHHANRDEFLDALAGQEALGRQPTADEASILATHSRFGGRAGEAGGRDTGADREGQRGGAGQSFREERETLFQGGGLGPEIEEAAGLARGGDLVQALTQVEAALLAKYPDIESLSLFAVRGDIKLNMLAVKRGRRKEGIGSAAMQDLAGFADATGRRIVLTTGQKDPAFGTTSSGRLKRFYKRFGFVENKGRNKDFAISENMLREPRGVDQLNQRGASRQEQIESPEFKRFFEGSQVVNEDGSPRVVHHATFGEFDEFRTDQQMGAHFGTDRAARDLFRGKRDISAFVQSRRRGDSGIPTRQDIEDGAQGGQTVPVYLSIKNPLRLPDRAEWVALDVLHEARRAGVSLPTSIPGAFRGDEQADTATVQNLLREAGYDGIVYENQSEDKGQDSYIAFDPGQIKSAIGNQGTFDPNDPSILRQGPKGSIGFAANQPAVIRLFEDADETTLIHETAHWFRRLLPEADQQTLNEWVGAKDGNWTAAQEERWAEAVETHLFGRTSTDAPRSLLQRAKDWLKGLFQRMKGQAPDNKLNKPAQAVLEGLLGGRQRSRQLQRSLQSKRGGRPAGGESGTQAGSALLRQDPGRDPSQSFEVPDETARRLLQRKLQDRFSRVTTIQESPDLAPDTPNVRRAMDLYIGKASARLEGFEEAMVENRKGDAFLQRLVKAGVSVDQFGEFLYARHAKERNARIKSEFDRDNGSGLTDAEADTILSNYPEGHAVYGFEKEFRRRVVNHTLDVQQVAGILSQDTVDTLRDTYKRYVPLKGKAGKDSFPSAGRGFEVSGSGIRRAKGRASLADNPFVQAMVDHQQAIVRAEKNRVGQRFLAMVRKNPSSMWSAKKQQWLPRYDKEGNVQYMDPIIEGSKTTMAVQEDGRTTYIEIKDEPLARAMLNLGAGRGVPLLSNIGAMLRGAFITYSPEFLLNNPIRDMQTALTHLTGDQSVKLAAKVMKDTPAAQKAIWRTARRKKDPGEWGDWYEHFKLDGATIGWVHIQSVEELTGDLAKRVENFNPKSPVVEALASVPRLMQDANQATEMGVRLSAYRHLRENGMDGEEAAQAARNLTVDFNTQGEWRWINQYMLFFNSSLGGSARIFKALADSPKVQAIAGGLMLSGFMRSYLNRLVDEDDWEDIPPHIKDTYWLAGIPGADETVFASMKMPYGYNVFVVTGTVIEEMVNGKLPLPEAMSRIAGSIVDAFTPLSTGSLAQMIYPTFLQPVVQVGENKTFYGGLIKPNQPPFSEDVPQSSLYFNGVRDNTKAATTWLNKITGGSETVAGAVDVSPEDVDHIIDAYAGGMGRFMFQSFGLAESALSGDGLPDMRKIPVLRQWVQKPSEQTPLRFAFDALRKSKVKVFPDDQVERFNEAVDRAVKRGGIEGKKGRKMKRQFRENQREARASLRQE